MMTRMIKLLRSFEFSISEIKEVLSLCESIDDLYLKVKELQHRKFNDAPAVKATYLNFLKELDRKLDINDFKRDYQDKSIHFKTVTGEEVNVVFEKLHKYSAESRKINCYSCGYGSCYEFCNCYVSVS